MNSSFSTISDTKYHFISNVAIRNVILNAGRKQKIAFVEGCDDKVVFDILYKENRLDFAFIDVSNHKEQMGGCDKVKSFLKQCVASLPTDKRFFGIIDRDLNTDADIEIEKNLPDYDNRLFIFTERYTLENYFVDIDVLAEFLRGQSINHKSLIRLINDAEKLKQIVSEIILCLANVAAANFTIRHFDNTKQFIERSIECGEIEIKQRIQHLFQTVEVARVNERFDHFRELVNGDGLKFASAKDYFAAQFNIHLEKLYKVNIQLNNHKSELARILKEKLPFEFKQLREFIMANNTQSQ